MMRTLQALLLSVLATCTVATLGVFSWPGRYSTEGFVNCLETAASLARRLGLEPRQLLVPIFSGPVMAILDDRYLTTRYGRLHLETDTTAPRLQLSCRPCRIQHALLAPIALTNLAVTLDAELDPAGVHGTVTVDGVSIAYRLHLLGPRLVAGEADMQDTDLEHLYELFRDAVPELGRVSIAGRVRSRLSFSLQPRSLRLTPQLEDVTISGLGTETLAYGGFRYMRRDAQGMACWALTGEGSDDWLTLAAMGPLLPRTVIAAEDTRFYRHPGYDLREVAKVMPGRWRGASTITQQLAKNLFLRPEYTLVRKLRELLYAVEMERTLGKRRILELYLNIAEWAPGVYGAKAATNHYLHRRPARLSLAEGAWLAGVLRSRRLQQSVFSVATETLRWQRAQWVLQQTRGQSRRSIAHALRQSEAALRSLRALASPQFAASNLAG